MSKKYSYEFKLNVVQDYLNGTLGYTLLTKKHAISDSDLIGKWVNQYKTFGKDGLKRKKTNKKYPLNFKLDVLDTANAFGITEPSIIANNIVFHWLFI